MMANIGITVSAVGFGHENVKAATAGDTPLCPEMPVGVIRNIPSDYHLDGYIRVLIFKTAGLAGKCINDPRAPIFRGTIAASSQVTSGGGVSVVYYTPSARTPKVVPQGAITAFPPASALDLSSAIAGFPVPAAPAVG